MKKELRIIDGVLKVVEVVDGKIVKIIKDDKKSAANKHKNVDQVKREKDANLYTDNLRLIEEREMIKSQRHKMRKEEVDAYSERMHKLEEKERIHEIHYGKRHKYLTEKKTSGLDKKTKKLLKRKAELGIIDESVLDMKNSDDLLDDWAKEKSFHSYEDYLNSIAIGRGFICYLEYEQVWSFYPRMPSPIKENRKDRRFIGVYIGENAVAKLYDESKRMPYFNPGYDIICPKGYKIDVKSTVLSRYNTFGFAINKNKIADYFVLVAFNNIIELAPIHLWVVKSDENIDGKMVNQLYKLAIINEQRYIDKYSKYEKLDKLDILKNLCKEFGAENRIEINDDGIINRYALQNIAAQIKEDPSKKISLIDILDILERKPKKTKTERVPIIPEEDVL